MTWHSPKTWAALYEVKAADFNYEIRDLLNTLWVGTTQGDLEYYTSSTAKSRLAKGTARQNLTMNAGATAPEWTASPASLMTATGDILIASAANTPARLGKGSAKQVLTTNDAGTLPEWGDSPANILTATGDLLYASAANTPARLAKGTARQMLSMKSDATIPEWTSSPASLLTATGDLLYASSANTPARLARGSAYQLLRVNSGGANIEWHDSIAGIMADAGDMVYAQTSHVPVQIPIGDNHDILQIHAGVPTWSAHQSFYPFLSPLTSTSWDGDAHSTTGKTTIHLDSVFGSELADAEAILCKVQVRDSQSSGSECYFILGPNTDDLSGAIVSPQGRPNDVWESQMMVVPCGPYDGDICYQILATGTNTLDVYLSIWGFWDRY